MRGSTASVGTTHTGRPPSAVAADDPGTRERTRRRGRTDGMRLAGDADAVPPSFNSSCLCITRVVYGAMFSDDGKRTRASILRAADLSTDLCSKRCQV